MLYCCILFNSILFYSILFYSILFYSILFYSILIYCVVLLEAGTGELTEAATPRLHCLGTFCVHKNAYVMKDNDDPVCTFSVSFWVQRM